MVRRLPSSTLFPYTTLFRFTLDDVAGKPPMLDVALSKCDPRGRLSVAKLIARSISTTDRKSTRLNSSHVSISYAVFCLKKKDRSIGEHALSPARSMEESQKS